VEQLGEIDGSSATYIMDCVSFRIEGNQIRIEMEEN